MLDEGDAYDMEIAKFAIDNVDDFAKSQFKTKASHALVRIELTDDKRDKQITTQRSDHVAKLVFDRVDLYNTLKTRDSIEC